MKKQKLYTEKALLQADKAYKKIGGTFHKFYKDHFIPVYVFTAPGYKTTIFYYIGAEYTTEETQLYKVKIYNETPKKYK